MSNGPFQRLGGYRQFLERQDLKDPEGVRLDVRGRFLPASWKYSDTELLNAFTLVEHRVGHLPTEAEYRRQRELLRDENLFLPSVSTLTSRFGGNWKAVQSAVTGDPEG